VPLLGANAGTPIAAEAAMRRWGSQDPPAGRYVGRW